MNSKTKKSKLTIILYSFNKLPVVYNLNKSILQFYLVFPVVIFVLAFFTLLVIFNFDKIKANISNNTIIEKNINLIKKVELLNQEITTINNSKKILSKKLEKGLSANGLTHFSFFKQMSGQVFKNSLMVKLTDFTIKKSNKNINVSFIINNLSDGKKKLSGYLFFLLKTSNSIAIWPTQDLDSFQINYKNGQLFATTRFRPFNFKLENFINQDTYISKIFIFDRLGDLIYISKQVNNE